MTARKIVLVVGGSITALLLASAAFVMVLLATAPGHRLVRNYAIRALGNIVDGEVRLGEVTGSLWKAAEVRDVELLDSEGVMVIRAARVRVGFALPNILRGRIILSGVTIVRPSITLIQDSSGAWNVQRLFKLGDTDTSVAPAPRPLVELRGVTIEDGMVTVRPYGRETDLTATGLNLELTSLRASHPDSTAATAVVRSFAGRLHDPAVEVLNAEGAISLDGDSLRFDLADVRLAGTRGTLTGVVDLGGERPAFEARVVARPFSFADLRRLDERIPREGSGSIVADVRWLPNGTQEYLAREFAVRSGRSVARGSGRVTVSPRGAVAVRGVDLTLEPFDLAVLRPFVDSLPVQGTVSGRVRADGAITALTVSTGIAFSDESVRPAVVSRVSGAGMVRWSADSGFAIPGFDVISSDLQLASAQQFFPELALTGRVEVVGHVEVAAHLVTWGGTLRHVATTGASVFAGTGRVELGDSTVLSAEVIADSIRFDAVRELLPGFPLQGAAAGRIRIDGTLAALGFEIAMGGAWGKIEGRGALSDTERSFTIIGEGIFDSLDVSQHVEHAPRTRLAGTWAVGLTLPSDSLEQPSGNIEVALTPSLVEGVRLSGYAGLAFVPGRLLLDSARVIMPGGSLRAAGALGFPRTPPGQITWQLRVDTLASMEPLLRYALRISGDTSEARLDGHGDLSGRVIGTLSEWEADGRISVSRIEAAGALARGVDGTWQFARNADGISFGAALRADTASAAGFGYAPVRLVVGGRADSISVNAEAGFIAGSNVKLTAVYQTDSLRQSVLLQSLELELPAGDWVLAVPAHFAITEASITVDTLRLRSQRGTGQLTLYGSIPRAEPGDLTLDGDSLPVADIFAVLGRDTTGLGGALDISGRLTGPASAPAMEVQIYLSDGRFGTYSAPELQVLATYAERSVSLKGGLWDDSTQLVSLSGTIPIDLALTGVAERKLPGPLSISVRADSADLSIVRLFTSDVSDPRGATNLDVQISGTWQSQTLSGHAELINGAVSLPAIGARYSEINARLALEDSVVSIESARLRGGDGHLTLAGTATFRPGQSPRLDLTATASRFHAMDIRNFAGLTGSGTIQLRGPAIGATLSGRLTVDEGYLRFADLVEKRIINLDDPEFRAIVESTLARAQELRPGIHTIFLDSMRIRGMTVVMGPDVWLRSSEANIQLAGEFQVAKDIEYGLPRYRMDGTMRAVRGTYRLAFGTGSTSYLAREFRVTRGTVRFFGTPDFDPEMDIAAEHVVRRADGSGNITVRAVIGGTLRTPRLRLESDERPPLTEIELVSFLLTGRPVSALTQRGGFDPIRDGAVLMLGELSQALVGGIGLPLDVLSIRPGQGLAGSRVDSAIEDALTGATIEAGVQIGSRTYISANAGLCELSSSQRFGLSVEYRLSQQFTTQVSLEPVAQGQCRSGGAALENSTVNWQWGFDLFWFLGGYR